MQPVKQLNTKRRCEWLFVAVLARCMILKYCSLLLVLIPTEHNATTFDFRECNIKCAEVPTASPAWTPKNHNKYSRAPAV